MTYKNGNSSVLIEIRKEWKENKSIFFVFDIDLNFKEINKEISLPDTSQAAIS